MFNLKSVVFLIVIVTICSKSLNLKKSLSYKKQNNNNAGASGQVQGQFSGSATGGMSGQIKENINQNAEAKLNEAGRIEESVKATTSGTATGSFGGNQNQELNGSGNINAENHIHHEHSEHHGHHDNGNHNGEERRHDHEDEKDCRKPEVEADEIDLDEDVHADLDERIGEEVFMGADVDAEEAYRSPFELELEHFNFLLEAAAELEVAAELANQTTSNAGLNAEVLGEAKLDEEDLVHINLFAEFVRDEFNRTDTDASGNITLEEYQNRLEQIAKRFHIPKEAFSEQAAMELYASVNIDGDDNLNYEEFTVLVKSAVELLVKYFESIKGTPMEKLFNISEQIQLVKYFQGPEANIEQHSEVRENVEADAELDGEAVLENDSNPHDDSVDLSGEEDRMEDPLDYMYDDILYYKDEVTLDDAAELFVGICQVAQVRLDLAEEIVFNIHGEFSIDAEEFKAAVKGALRELLETLENKKADLEERIRSEAEAKAAAEAEVDASAYGDVSASFLKKVRKIKSLTKSRKAKKSLKMRMRNRKH